MWAWTQVRDTALDALLRPNMKALEDDLKRRQKYAEVQALVRTSDATVTTLYDATVPVDHTVVFEGIVAARRTGGSAGAANDGAGYLVSFCAKNTSGTAALIGSLVTVLGESQSGWDCTLSASGGTIRVRVTGAANNNVVWVWTGRSLSVKE